MNKAIFLDRDGVIVEETGYIRSLSDMRIYPYAKECIGQCRSMGYLTIVITNQSGIARGYFSEDELKRMNEKLIKELGVDAVYYCPHYKDGIIEKYSHACDCRKPATGMIKRACKEHEIDLRQSILIGDRASDIRTGINAGVRTILLRTGYGKEDEKKEIKPDVVCEDLRDAVKIICETENDT